MGAATLTEADPTAASPTRTLRQWHDEVRALQRAGDLDEAIDLLARLVAAAPAAHVQRLRRDLIVLLRLAEREAEADRVAVELDPGDATAWARLSRHARVVDDRDLFVASSLGWHEAAPDDAVAAHFAAIARTIRDGSDHDGCSVGYVREVFDHYAERFDSHLAQLRYRGPQAVAGLVHGVITDGDLTSDAAIADLGCGTGLVGEHLRAGTDTDGRPVWSGHLVGVDLAPKMRERAAARTIDDPAGSRPVYDEVVDADLVTFLAGRTDTLDAVVAVDTFIYVGDLRPTFAAAATALRPGGWLVATVEHAIDGRAAERGHVADVSGRFLHDADWIEQELGRRGFDLVVVDDLSIRDERHLPVPGLVIVARTSPSRRSSSAPGG